VTTVPLYHEIEGSGPDLVLLHGGGGSSGDLAGLRARLRRSHRVLAPDQRGHGRSPDAEPISYVAMAADTAVFLDALGTRNADVVGWSDGGIVAMLVALNRPDLVGRAVVVGANVDGRPPAPPNLSAEASAWLASATPGDAGLPDSDRSRQLIAMWQAPPGITLDDLGRVTAPLLVVAADRDLVPLEHTIAMFRAASRAQLAIVPGTGHDLPVTHPDLLGDLVERFLAVEQATG
jgi:pimeloyl-ACP methyl ester carboxylesterase